MQIHSVAPAVEAENASAPVATKAIEIAALIVFFIKLINPLLVLSRRFSCKVPPRAHWRSYATRSTLIGQYLRRTSERGGRFWGFGKGVSLGCPLSPLIGAFFLSAVDDALEKTGLFYIRFMDDILVPAPSRWKLRHAVRTVNQGLASLAVEKHPDKTFIDRIERGFDFLGYHFSRAGLTIARKTIAN